MPKEQEEFRNSVERILEAVMFENWLRFYFITPMHDEKDPEDAEPHLFLILSEKTLDKIDKLYPHLLPLALSMNNKELSFELSQQSICTYVVENIDGVIMPRDTAGSIMDSLTFQTELELFNTWLSLHESQLEQGFSDFGTWKDLFNTWNQSAKGQELREKLFLAKQKSSRVNAGS